MGEWTEAELESLHDFFFELGLLKQLPRSGWFKAGITQPESIAEHSFRTAMIGFVLATLTEREVDPHRIAFYCLTHDLAEARTSDLDWVAQQYLEKEDYRNEEVLRDQIDPLPEKSGRELAHSLGLTSDFSEEDLNLIRDADLLEAAFQGIAYVSSGHQLAKEWVESSVGLLKTRVGKMVGEQLQKRLEKEEAEDLVGWWKEYNFQEPSK
ncbi:MAG: HD domain-containing protein [Candidatus Bipolaricaulota bacterium]